MRWRGNILLAALSVFGAANTTLADSALDRIDTAIATADYDRALVLINTELATAPGDVSLRLRRARVHSYFGNDPAALLELDALRDEYPHDVDYALARARILARQNRDDEALEDLRQATALAPDYEDVWRLRHTLLSRHQGEAMQIELEALSREAATRFPDARWWRPEVPADSDEWTVVVGVGHEDLDNDLPSWNQQFVEVSRDFDTRARYRFGVARDERFGDSDLSVSLGADTFFASGWSAGLDLVFVDEPRFQPDFGYSAYVGKSLAEGWAVNLGYRRREYETATVGTTTGLLEKYVGDFRIAYAVGLSHLHGASNSLGHSLTTNWYYSDRASIGLSLNTGEEAEAIGPGQVLETDVHGVSVTGRREIAERFTLHWWLGLHEQGDFYRRTYLGMALTIGL